MMKNVSLFIVLIGFLFFSCKKWQRNESHNDFTVEKLIVDTLIPQHYYKIFFLST